MDRIECFRLIGLIRSRFCATMRRPACSIMALIAPVRLRAVASGLMMEKVRSMAIGELLLNRKNWGAGGALQLSKVARVTQAQ